jgi:hypothetical protein
VRPRWRFQSSRRTSYGRGNGEFQLQLVSKVRASVHDGLCYQPECLELVLRNVVDEKTDELEDAGGIVVCIGTRRRRKTSNESQSYAPDREHPCENWVYAARDDIFDLLVQHGHRNSEEASARQA